jgi:hypothetical protein
LVFAIVTKKLRKYINHVIFLDRLPKLHNILQIAITFSLACLSWVFFRANSTQEAINIIYKISSFNGSLYLGEWQHFLYGILSLSFLILIEYQNEYYSKNRPPDLKNKWYNEQLAYGLLIILILLIGVFDGGQFIYFQF